MVVALIIFVNQVPDEAGKQLIIKKLQPRLDEIAFKLKCCHNLNQAHIKKQIHFAENTKIRFNRISFTLDSPLESHIDFPEVAEIAHSHLDSSMDVDLEVKFDRKKILQPLVA